MNTETRITRRAASAALAGASVLRGADGPRPNILLLHCHDLGRHLHCYGVPTVQTPHLDRFASEGVLFERSFCAAPQCSPSRASIFTGRYPHSNGVMGLTHANFAWELNPREQHMGQILRGAGYATAGVGVLHETHSGPQRCGLDEYTAGSAAAMIADATIARLTAFAQNRSKPFYLQAGCIEPHRLGGRDRNGDNGFLGTSLQPDSSLGVHIPPFLRDTPGTRTELAELQGAVRHMDAQMGRVLQALSDLKLDQNTLVVFTTDHGIAMPRAKCSVYEPGLQTSLIFRYPRREGWHGGTRRREMISNVDYLPTLLAAADVPVPRTVQGMSFAPLLDGAQFTPRETVFGEMTYHDYYDPRRSIRTESHKLIVNFSSAPAFMDPSQSWRPRSDTVTPPNHALAYHNPFELYDLRTDPWEQQDLASDTANRGTLDALRKQLFRHMRETSDPILDGAVTSPLHRRSQAWLRDGAAGGG